ncbi:MAG: dynamin family protein [Clostridiales bacterium]|nr:dynamin family protein [Clostridiales bacterium]
MERIQKALAELQEINKRYEISEEPIEKLRQEASEAKVSTPVIGKFSSGKSALVNTLLGYSQKILKEDITPETAIPAEITYTDSDEKVIILKKDGSEEIIDVEDYHKCEFDAKTVKCARIQLRNRFLEKIPDVMIVDMPGFESGNEIHNQAIDNYVVQSLAYIVAFPADDMIVRNSVGDILRELCLHDMPICVVITKYDKKTDDFDETFAHLEESLKRYIGDREIPFCRTSSQIGEAEEMEEFLENIQEQSQDILFRSFSRSVCHIAENTENYLKTIQTNSQLTPSELEEKEEKIQTKYDRLDSELSRERECFERDISGCIEEIKNDVQLALDAEEDNLVSMAMNKQDITGRLNVIVRKAVTKSVKNRLIPKLERYMERVSDSVSHENLGDVHILVPFDMEKLNKRITGSTVAAVAGVVTAFLGGFVTPLAMVVTSLVLKNKNRNEAKKQVIGKLRTEVFPQVLDEVGKEIDRIVKEQISLVNISVEADIKSQKETLEQALNDIRGQKDKEKCNKEKLAHVIEEDLEKIGEIKNGLR